MNTIRQGTTPVCKFTTPFYETDVEQIYISFRQGQEILVEKTDEDIIWEGTSATVHLTQKDTFMFQHSQYGDRGLGEVQIRLKLNSGEAVASQIIQFGVSESIKKEVI